MNAAVHLNSRRNAACASPYPTQLDAVLASFLRPATSERAQLSAIKIDVSEDATAYRVSASLPGVKKEDINVAVEKNEVSISAEIKRETNTDERLLHSERFVGQASRVFTLAQEIDEAQIVAKYVDGVLNLTLPKKVVAAAKRVVVG
jgi:HSP20 family protein